MGKDPAMPFYVNDWLSSRRVQAMTQLQELAYFRLLAFCWSSGDASIPDDDDELAVLSRMGKTWLKGGSSVVRKCFEPHPHKSAHLTNKRLFDLWSERQEWREKSKEGGIKSGQARKLRSAKGGSTKREPNGNSSSSSSSIYKPPISPPSHAKNDAHQNGDDAFQRFWKTYPRKVGKRAAKAAWNKAIEAVRKETLCSAADATALIERAAGVFAESDTAKSEFCPHPSTWLNQGRYDDDQAAWKRNGHVEPEQVVCQPLTSEEIERLTYNPVTGLSDGP